MPLTDKEKESFVAISKKKRATITFVEDPKEHIREGGEIHLDLDMVEASIKNCVERCHADGNTRGEQKVKRLLDKGSDAEKIEFVLGSGRYYFPEDLESMARRFRAAQKKGADMGNCKEECEDLCWVRCYCQLKPPYNQLCGIVCRQVCHIVCP